MPNEAAVPPETVITVLLVGPADAGRFALRKILAPPQWELREAGSSREAVWILDHSLIGVAICDTELQEGNWRDLLADFQNRRDPPKLIVSSPHADERLWAEVLNLGGYDVLVHPFDPEEVLRAIRMGWLSWHQARGRQGALAALVSG